MSTMLFNVIRAAHANGTHHKLALDALRYMQADDALAWRALFLKHAEIYLAGSKAPDRDFKDFKNHVLHVRDDYWGGAPEKVESWYRMLVQELECGNWEQAVWCAGVLSHYYTDPIHPFHTAQCDAENNIHRAVEWSIAQSYNDLRQLGLRYPLPDIQPGTDEGWLKEMVIVGAELANCHYEALIAGFNFEIGVVDPPAGLDPVARHAVGRLLVYASCGFAHILDRAFEEAGVSAPRVKLTAEAVLATLKIPLKWVANRMENAEEARLLKRMYDEYRTTGRVDAALSEDDRVVRDLHAAEVLEPLRFQRDALRADRHTSSPLPQGSFFHTATLPQRPGGDVEVQTVEVCEGRQVRGAATAAKVAPRHTSIAGEPPYITQFRAAEASDAPAYGSQTYLKLADPVEAAPSIGSKTAKRLAAVGIITVEDLLGADTQELARSLSVRYIRRQTIADWQDQARLMLYIRGLRGTHAQLCVGAGYRSLKAIASVDPAEMNAAILRFVATSEGQRILGGSHLPDLDAISGWVETTSEALAA